MAPDLAHGLRMLVISTLRDFRGKREESTVHL